MRRLLVAMCVLGMPCVASAQASKAPWSNLNTLQAGQKIQVVHMDLRKESGKFLNVSDSAISLREKSGEQTIQKQDVRSVKLMEHKHRLRNTLVGGALGAAAGAGSFGAAGGRGSLSGLVAAGGAAVGFVIGAVVGALWPSHPTMYRAATH